MAISILVNKFHEAIEQNNIMVGLFIDLSRAFDTISPEILLNKLHIYGIRGIAYDWLRDYLNNRKQFVSYQNVHSPMCNVNIGAPQG